MADAAAQGDDLRLEDVDKVGQPLRQILQVLVHHRSGGHVALAHGLEGGAAIHPVQRAAHQAPHGGVRVLIHGGGGLADEGVGGGVPLPAAPAAAGTLVAVVDDDDVPALAGAAVDTGVDPAAQDDAGADAGAQGDQNQALNIPVLIVVVFPQGCAVRVVAQVDRQVPVLMEHLRHRHGADGNVDGLDDHAPLIIHRTGEPHTHRGHLFTGNTVLLNEPDGHFRQGLPHVLHGFEFQGHFLGGRDLVALIHQPGLQIGPADVNADIIHRIPPHEILSIAISCRAVRTPGPGAPVRRPGSGRR